jgi:hypothetical protein
MGRRLTRSLVVVGAGKILTLPHAFVQSYIRPQGNTVLADDIWREKKSETIIFNSDDGGGQVCLYTGENWQACQDTYIGHFHSGEPRPETDF